ncbi:hypothetical protein ABH14_28640 [Brevibacillus brevis]|uniref:hypothetical protein n=1 Tax=Brevibacillus brevis TaxID=1393 RepID=UPI0018FFE61A|nr:hypothetical protein [Brevibacillus brevis]MBH0333651.1 hypothetical protein [Brevibacillus brevis]
MLNPLGDFLYFMALVDDVCGKLGLDRNDFSTPEELFQTIMERLPLKSLVKFDEMCGDDYLRDDFLGIMHRAVRSRIDEIRQAPLKAIESGRSA